MSSTAYEAWVRKARSVHIEDEIERRDIKINGNGRERVGPCPKCGGDDRFSINTKKQVWNCRGCSKGGGVIDLVEHLDDVGFAQACETLTGEPPPIAKKRIAEFRYPDETGTLEFAVERIEYRDAVGNPVLTKDGKHKKSFAQKRPDPDHTGRWIYNAKGCRVLPYRLPQVLRAIADGQHICIVEGEAKADLLASWGIDATCNAGGAGKWKSEHSTFLKDADVVLVPDHDDAGWKHINSVGESLTGIAKRVRVVVLPDLRPKGDIINWVATGGTREQFDALVAKAADWTPREQTAEEKDKAKAQGKEDELLAALAKMPKGVARGRERKRVAKELGVSRSDIDDEIEARQAEAETVALLHGHWFVEPWPEPINGDALIRDIIKKLQKHVVISHDLALAIALWLILAWVHDEIAVHSPILVFTSAETASGKTTALGITSFLMRRAIASVDISKAALYRSIKLWQPSFAIDEFDDVLKDATDPNKAELRSVINGGHTRGMFVIRCITDEHTPEAFPIFASKTLGMIGRKMPPQTLSRGIFIEMRRRKKKSERVVKFKHEDDSELADLRGRLCRYALDNAQTLRNAAPSTAMPEQFDDRLEDNWRVQFAIADLAGEDWGDKARAAAIEIEKGSDSRTLGARLLTDIKAAFHPKDEKGNPLPPLERLSSADLIDRLCTYADSP